MSALELDALAEALNSFVTARDWDQFHSPKNLSMAITIEAAELAEHFLWTDPRDPEELTPEKKEQVELEVADVFLYVLRLSQVMDIDLIAVARKKLAINETKYPADKVRGSAKKYSEFP
jgi:dCTP diphosphatase